MSPGSWSSAPSEPDLVAACGALVADVYGGEQLLEDEDGYLHRVADAMPRAREAVLLAALDGEELLGTTTYARSATPFAELARAGEAEMRMLAVAPAARGGASGRLLTEACLDRAREEGCHRFVLSSGPRMTGAHAMYEGMGFAPQPRAGLVARCPGSTCGPTRLDLLRRGRRAGERRTRRSTTTRRAEAAPPRRRAGRAGRSRSRGPAGRRARRRRPARQAGRLQQLDGDAPGERGAGERRTGAAGRSEPAQQDESSA